MCMNNHYAHRCDSHYLHCRYIIVVEHDLSVLDYLSDYICCLYGAPGAYGVVTMPFSVREGELHGESILIILCIFSRTNCISNNYCRFRNTRLSLSAQCWGNLLGRESGE